MRRGATQKGQPLLALGVGKRLESRTGVSDLTRENGAFAGAANATFASVRQADMLPQAGLQQVLLSICLKGVATWAEGDLIGHVDTFSVTMLRCCAS